MKDRLHNNIFDKLWKKCLVVFIIIFVIVAVGGAYTVNYLNDVVDDNHVHASIITVKDKIYGDNPYSDYYIIVGDDNRTYSIIDHGDDYGKNMFDSIKIGYTYEMIIKEPELIELNQFPHIIQVHNDTDSDL